MRSNSNSTDPRKTARVSQYASYRVDIYLSIRNSAWENIYCTYKYLNINVTFLLIKLPVTKVVRMYRRDVY